MLAGSTEQESTDCWVSDAMELHLARNTSSSMGTLGCLGTRHPEQAELLLLHLAGALALEEQGGGQVRDLLLFEGPESGHILEKPV